SLVPTPTPTPPLSLHDALPIFDRLDRLVPGGRRQAVLIRVTPGVRGDTHEAISTGQVDSKFGLSIGDARAATERVGAADHLELAGLHVHIGSQILELDPFRRAVQAIAEPGDF